MSVVPGNPSPRRSLLFAALVVSVAVTSAARAQSGGTDTDVNPETPVVSRTPEPPPLQAAVASLNPTMRPAPAIANAIVQPVSLDHPTVIDTARLQSGATIVNLFGIDGLSGEPADGLRGFLASTDNHLTCQAHDTASFVCLMTDGTDLAQVALVNGVAQTRPDAPDVYRQQEAAAQQARRGIWSNLPPPPETIDHPVVPNTATLAAGGKMYALDGLEGFGPPYAGQLQGYIAANGDSLSCSLQGGSGRYLCLQRDGTDIAKVALVNGAARVAPDAPDSYRVQQADAVNNRRGYWFNLPPDVLAAALVMPQPDEYVLLSGDEGVDGISYVGGAPMAVIDGESVFLEYGDGLGWGYYDGGHHWHGAPDRYRAHMEHFHPYGHGLRGYRDGGFRHEEAMHRDAAYRQADAMHREAGYRQEGAMHREAGYPHEEAMRREGPVNHGEAMRAGSVPHQATMPGAPGHAAGPGAGFGHPGAPGGGFVRPGAMASAGGFHPGAAAPMAHASPAAAHASVGGGGGGGKRH